MARLNDPDEVLGGWSRGQVREFVAMLRRDLGDGWRFMTTEVREAFVAARAFEVVRSQHRGTIEIERADRLLLAMLVEAGLRE